MPGAQAGSRRYGPAADAVTGKRPEVSTVRGTESILLVEDDADLARWVMNLNDSEKIECRLTRTGKNNRARRSRESGAKSKSEDSDAARLRGGWIAIGIAVLPLLTFVTKTGAGPIKWIRRPGFDDRPPSKASAWAHGWRS